MLATEEAVSGSRDVFTRSGGVFKLNDTVVSEKPVVSYAPLPRSLGNTTISVFRALLPSLPVSVSRHILRWLRLITRRKVNGSWPSIM